LNEAQDCRNYANAAFRVWNPDLNRIFQKLKEPIEKPATPLIMPKKKKTNNVFNTDW
jgi:hypothetical protein